jgi:hypothetical protein
VSRALGTETARQLGMGQRIYLAAKFRKIIFMRSFRANLCPTFFFQLPLLMLMLITLLNDGALISVGYDIVRPSPNPEQ